MSFERTSELWSSTKPKSMPASDGCAKWKPRANCKCLSGCTQEVGQRQRKLSQNFRRVWPGQGPRLNNRTVYCYSAVGEAPNKHASGEVHQDRREDPPADSQPKADHRGRLVHGDRYGADFELACVACLQNRFQIPINCKELLSLTLCKHAHTDICI